MGNRDRRRGPKVDVVAMIPALRAYAISLTRDRSEADELVHDTLLNAVTIIPQFGSGIDPRVLLFINIRSRFYTGEKRSMERLDRVTDPPSYEPGTAEELPGPILSNGLLVAISRLPAPFRETLMLVVVLGESYETCALITNCEREHVKSRLEWAVPRITAELQVITT